MGKKHPLLKDGWYWIDTRWACGGVRTLRQTIVETAPIFWKFKGQKLLEVSRKGGYQIEYVGEYHEY